MRCLWWWLLLLFCGVVCLEFLLHGLVDCVEDVCGGFGGSCNFGLVVLLQGLVQFFCLFSESGEAREAASCCSPRCGRGLGLLLGGHCSSVFHRVRESCTLLRCVASFACCLATTSSRATSKPGSTMHPNHQLSKQEYKPCTPTL